MCAQCKMAVFDLFPASNTNSQSSTVILTDDEIQ